MLTRILGAGLLAGVLAGLFVSGLQHVTTVPLILKAETYEKAAEKPAAEHHSSLKTSGGAKLVLVHGGAAEPAETGAAVEAWAPADGLERTAYTSLATVGTAVGFALMLLAAMIASGASITMRSAALWGAAAFVATGLAPGMGLPPELPGSAAGDLFLRQTWWIGTAAATAAGIWLIFASQRGTAAAIAGIALIALPHIIGAPVAHEFASTVPAELAGHFTATSLAVHAVLWVLVGTAAGYFWERLGRSQALA
jgi:cobalt transporter subunit CbtA